MTANILANNLTPKELVVKKKKKFYTISKGNNHKAYFSGKKHLKI